MPEMVNLRRVFSLPQSSQALGLIYIILFLPSDPCQLPSIFWEAGNDGYRQHWSTNNNIDKITTTLTHSSTNRPPVKSMYSILYFEFEHFLLLELETSLSLKTKVIPPLTLFFFSCNIIREKWFFFSFYEIYLKKLHTFIIVCDYIICANWVVL